MSIVLTSKTNHKKINKRRKKENHAIQVLKLQVILTGTKTYKSYQIIGKLLHTAKLHAADRLYTSKHTMHTHRRYDLLSYFFPENFFLLQFLTE